MLSTARRGRGRARGAPAGRVADAAATATPNGATTPPPPAAVPAPWPPIDAPIPAGAVKVASWNVASLRTVLRNGTLAAYVAAESPDVLCVQETRLQRGGVAAVVPALPPSLPYTYFACSGDDDGAVVVGGDADAAVVVADDADAAVGGAPTGGGGAAGGVGAAAAGAAAPPPPRKGRLGYSGTALLCKVRPLHVTAGFLPAATRDGATAAAAPAAAAARVPDTADGEGRVLTAEFADLVVVGVYVPNAGAALVRLPTRVGAGVAADGTGGGAARGGAGGWDARLRDHVAAAAAATGKPILLAGDCNCAHAAIDLSNPRTNERNAGFTPAERRSFSRLVGPPAGEEGGGGTEAPAGGVGGHARARGRRARRVAAATDASPAPADEGRVEVAPPTPPRARSPLPPPLLVDTLRAAYPSTVVYTFWSSRRGGEARRKNVGWRLDYVLATPSLATRLLAAWVRTAVVGSDHAPVGVTLMASLAPPPPPPRA